MPAPYFPIEKGLHEVLAPIATVYAKVPDSPTLPYITYQRVSTVRPSTLLGNSGLATARIQVKAYAASSVQAKQLTQLVRLAMLNARGVTWGSHAVGGCRLDNEMDDNDPDVVVDGSHGIFGVIHDWMITYKEEAAT